jgi:hypothetical protein
LVHVSITNPSHDSPFSYFRGKAAIEGMIRDSGLSHAIVRPTVIFGKEDILINKIAYLLRDREVHRLGARRAPGAVLARLGIFLPAFVFVSLLRPWSAWRAGERGPATSSMGSTSSRSG